MIRFAEQRSLSEKLRFPEPARTLHDSRHMIDVSRRRCVRPSGERTCCNNV